jgi:mannosyltransferase
MRPPVLAFIAALVYTGIGLSVPSFWTDEAATISAVDRSLPDLVRMVGNIDAVHGCYYFFMHLWTSIFGLSEVSLRVPSLLAVSVSAGMVAAIGRRIGSAGYGLAAAALFVLLPRTQYVGTDARSYALALAASVTATYFLVRLREQPDTRFLIGYALAGLVATSLSFYAVLVLLSHATTVLLDPALRSRWRSLAVVSPAWLVPAALLAIIGARQQFQIAWLRPIDGGITAEVALLQFFSDAYFIVDAKVTPAPTPLESVGSIVLACVLSLLVALGLFRFRRNFIAALAVPLLVLPLTVVIGGSLLLGTPYYLPRYLTFVLPSVAFLSAAALRARKTPGHGRPWVPLCTVAAIAAVALPSYLGQRTEFGRDPSDDFRFVAETLQRHAQPGEAVALTGNSGLALLAYRDSFDGLTDVTSGISASQWGRIFDQRFDLETARDGILQHDSVWLVSAQDDAADTGNRTGTRGRAVR